MSTNRADTMLDLMKVSHSSLSLWNNLHASLGALLYEDTLSCVFA